MKVTLLGTADAAGWPNPWCRCSSCTWMRANGEVRGQTSAIVDGELWLDCGPEAPRAAARLGCDTTAVRYLLFTHAHPDHTGAATLMWRGWTGREDPIDVAGPPAVIAECRRWVADNAAIRWHPLAAGEVMPIGRFHVAALAAAHGDASIGPALLYDLTDEAGTRILWATDTAALPEPTVEAMRGAAYDAVFLEETNGDDLAATTDHLDLATWPEQIARLRACGAITETTQLVAIHLGHRNPPPPQLRDRMQAWRAHIPADGEIFTLGEPPAPRRVLVLGGARSGKSHWAESLLANCNDVGYVATAWPRPDDLEWQTRIEEHLRRRPATWSTYETFDVGAVIGKHNAVLVDCATLWLAGQLEKHDDIDALVAAVAEANGTVVVVSNEVGSGVVPATESGRQFRDKLGTLNAQLASACDEVWLVTAGLPRRLK